MGELLATTGAGELVRWRAHLMLEAEDTEAAIAEAKGGA